MGYLTAILFVLLGLACLAGAIHNAAFLLVGSLCCFVAAAGILAYNK